MNGKCLEVLGVNLKYTPDLIDINLSIMLICSLYYR